ncbi:MAG TPA: fibronectin type III domain-containing protein, partial [Anaerolineales bacterium]|nr:fibronectin type III domain-containing protein [Anaerolineales bacterium]
MKVSFWKNIIRFIEAQRLFLLLGVTLVVLAVGSGFWQTVAWSAEEAVDQVHASWEMDSATTMTIAWHTQAATAPSSLQYRQAGSAVWETAAGSATTTHDGGLLHRVTLEGLSPVTSYEYRLADGAGGWSQVFEAATAPPAGATGAAGFNVVYVADTGLQGRTDGLASGTEAVLTAVQSLQPLALLGGGDYAYYNTDTRYATLEEAIDAWFVQMQPLAAAAPLMPAYGNHELNDADDADGYDHWAARFFTSAGQYKQYSFDIG